MTKTRCLRTIAPLVAFTLVSAQAQEPVNLDVVHRIRDEALQNATSKVMDTVFYLTDVNGPRLTNSPGYFAAADWVVKQMKEWGIEAHQEKWGPFGRGWSYTHFSAHMIEPTYAPLIGFPLAWTPGTEGPVTGEVTIAVLNTEADFPNYKDKLKGKIVFLGTGRELTLSTDPLGTRYTDQQLASLAVADPTGGRGGRGVP